MVVRWTLAAVFAAVGLVPTAAAVGRPDTVPADEAVSGLLSHLPADAGTRFVTIDDLGSGRIVTLEVQTGMIKQVTGS